MARLVCILWVLWSGLAWASLPRQTITSPAGTFTYAFNAAGRQLASLQMPGSMTTFGYDAVGDQNLIQVQASGQTVDYHGYDYNGNGWITAARRRGAPNTISYSYGYDNIGQLASVQSLEPDGSTPRLNETLGYTYDASDNLASRSTSNTLVQTFTSDALNQLASITRSGTLTVSGSLTGAVATLGVNGKAAAIYSDGTFATTEGIALRNGNNLFVTAGSNSAGQLVLSTITSNRLPVAVGFSYDLNGNLTSDGQRFFEYDDENQLTAVTVSNAYRTEFTYDGLSRRRIVRDYTWSSAIDNWQSTNETRYLCDGYLPVQERDASGNVLVTYTRGLDLSGTFGGAGGIGGLLARTDNNGSAFYHADMGGNITSLTDSSGHAVARYLTDPFGRPLGMWGPLAPLNVMRFSSMPYYRDAGIVGYAFRFYDPTLQRWLNQDPVGEAGGINLYAFVGNNPVSRVDPFGLDPAFTPGTSMFSGLTASQQEQASEAVIAAVQYGLAALNAEIDRENQDMAQRIANVLGLGGSPTVVGDIKSGLDFVAMVGLPETGGVGDLGQLGKLGKVKCPPKVAAQISKAGLPTGGKTPFVPKLKKGPKGDLIMEKAEVASGPKSGKEGYVDDQGNIRIRDQAHAGYPMHWDVQVSGGADYFRVGMDGNDVTGAK